jgi:hypothetical protein
MTFRISLSTWPSFGLFPGLPGTYPMLNGPSSDRAMLSYLAIFLKLDLWSSRKAWEESEERPGGSWRCKRVRGNP